MSHLRYGIVGLRAGYLRQDSRPLAFIPIKAVRYARLEGTRLSLAKGPYGEVIWSFDIAGNVIETNADDRKLAIYILDSQRRKRRVMLLSALDDKSFARWSAWLVRASKSVLEMHYTMDRLISKGAFARVVLGNDLHTREQVAIKLIEKSNAPPSERKYYEREVKIMQTLSHPNIVQCFDVFDNRLRTRIVMEYIQGGTLSDIISDTKTPMPESTARRLMLDILCGVEYLHDMNTVHRDLKPDNCLLTSANPLEATVKLSDFGLSNFVAENGRQPCYPSDEHGVYTSAVGSPGFVAPEIFAARYGTAVDIWSCGVILYMLLSGGIMPFRGKSPSEIIVHAKKGDFGFENAIPQCSAAAKDLVRGLLNVDEKQRLTAKQALGHRWFREKNS
ncbi:Calcium/calmodulin-dependent protein kinase type 1 [Gracilariopsis chorda]|uniref:Calcium/calmodulin-dependent protein kinase type 1 n=1 Tax=Gracilariopsis chorda TaxID=448386 RepID=A0A2V3J801_9FLOR|nr:Calcium/calmodulin-dependent protein kinase type 1 [Gracilariopsis chorda]|eukprot:PXF50082.1 Calcium/calmodulin-dependent protein kinase type 1 [Gracilariopsis chorda]